MKREAPEIKISCWENGMIAVTGIETESTDKAGRTYYDCAIDAKDRRMVWNFKSRLMKTTSEVSG